MQIRRAQDRGKADLGWLRSAHTFSFGNYYDQDHLGFGNLRVINEDIVAPGKGFETHSHRDMEIFSYVLRGSLAHRDSMGNVRTIKSGEWQYMSAGAGVSHSEFNPSSLEEVHFVQIWIRPAKIGLVPSYAEARSSTEPGLQPVAGPAAPFKINQNAQIMMLNGSDAEVVWNLSPGRSAWIHVLAGQLLCGTTSLGIGDAAGVTTPGSISLRSSAGTQALIFDL